MHVKMNGEKEPSPQVGPGLTGESHPALVVAGRSMESGGSKHAEKVERSESSGKTLIRRFTGGLQRSSSVTEVDRKRKERISDVSEGPYKRKLCSAAFTLNEAITGITKTFKEMEKYLELKNTKTEIKEKSSCLRKHIALLNKNIVQDFIKANQYEIQEKMTFDADIQVDLTSEMSMKEDKQGDKNTNEYKLLQEIKKLKEENEFNKRQLNILTRKIKEIEKQDTRTKAELADKVCVEDVRSINNYEAYEKIRDKSWDETCFPNVRIEVGNPISQLNLMGSLVIVDSSDVKMEKSTQKLYRDRFPELLEMEKQVDILESTNTRTDNLKGKITTRHTIIKIKSSGLEKDLFDQVMAAKKCAEECNINQIATHKIADVSLETQRKLLQCVFKEELYKIVIYTPKREIKRNKPIAKASLDTIIISRREDDKLSYAETMRKLRYDINMKDIGTNIRKIKNTEKGIVLKVTEKTKGATENLVNKINSIVGRESASKKVDKEKVLIIKDIHETMDKNEIERAIGKIVQIKDMDIKVMEPRNFDKNGRRGTALVIAKEFIAEKLLKDKRIDMGWERCRIVEKITIERCYKCQNFGHKSFECKEKAAKPKCLKCGCEEHNTATCKAEKLKCYVCGKEGDEGHRADSMKCEKYRDLVQKAIAKGKEYDTNKENNQNQSA